MRHGIETSMRPQVAFGVNKITGVRQRMVISGGSLQKDKSAVA